MRWQALPIVGGAYQDDTRPWSAQDTINFIPVQAERNGTRTPAMLRCAPGFATFSASAQSAPCRGLHNVEGTLYGVIGDKLYTWALDGGATALGSIPGVERVSMAHNQIAGGNQLAIAANNSGYIYDTVAGTLTQITDEGFPGALYFAFIDSYIVGVDPSRNFIFNSALADATSYSTLDRAQAEAQPDKLMGIAVTHDELWVFGERTIQPFTDTGAAQAPFESNSNTVVEVGCASGHTIVNMDNSLFWLGNDGIVYRANGYTPQRVSTHPVEQAIGRCNRNAAFAFTFEDRGHKVYYLTFPDGETWGYDAASGEWHRRKSYGMDRWRVADLVYWNGHWVGGDYVNGKLYVLSWDCQQEDGQIFERRRVFGPVTDDQNPIIVNGVEIIANVGEMPGLSDSHRLNPVLTLSGDFPNGVVGDVVSYAYKVTGTHPTVTLQSGALPEGLSLSSAGVLTGVLQTAASYSWTLKATTPDGQVVTLQDSCTVAASTKLKWWLVDVSRSTGKFYTSATPSAFTSSEIRAPFVIPAFGVQYAGGRAVFVGSTQIDTTNDFSISANIQSTLISPPYAPNISVSADGVRKVGKALIVSDSSGHYAISNDGGLTWATHSMPGGAQLNAIARLANGRWVAQTNVWNFWYSDDGDVPINWAAASNASTAGSPTNLILPCGVGAFCIDNANGVRRTTNGSAWNYTASGVTGTFSGNLIGATDGANNAVMCTSLQNKVIASHDGGLTLTQVTVAGASSSGGASSVRYGGGQFVLCNKTSGAVFYSSDNGDTWAAATLPVDIITPSACYVGGAS